MTDTLTHQLRTGGDPRTLADYASLRDELAKLTHPARPDVNWKHAEKCCLALFEQNGVELQTAAWYTLARTHLTGLYGLNEGLAVLEALVSRQWGNLWPQPVHARMEILTSLSQRLQQVLRTLTLHYADLSQLYQAEQHLTRLGGVLQRLELKHLSQLDMLRTQLHNAAVRLENSDAAAGGVTLSAGAIPANREEPRPHPAAGNTQWVYVAQPEPQPNITVISESPPPAKPWKPFAAGVLTMLITGSAALWGWQSVNRPDPLTQRLEASLTLPEPLSAAQVQGITPGTLPAGEGIRRTQQQLARLNSLPPDWTLRYGSQLVQQAQALWPEQAKPLEQQWRNQLNAAALSAGTLSGWHQGMTQLQQLTDRLNALDERRGSYLTGSELKTMVFAITQSFNRAVPVEEQLRQLASPPDGQPVNSAQKKQAELALNALLSRYALITGEPVLPE
ncbi:VasL domain-containing protein [Atlantibacter hermannii]|uniref:VasL domain-containing protein n=1 Tax=Atlantibacter hermannii TaxID=565 RepID=UPI001931E5D0|nr:VasL domain-containing protein [Atlantibacter hermannii]MBL7636549.1 type VI secretion system ImpA family N-terminal domain-containing protein [Atlantibacter hermannii]MBL7676418.1 type VI secretion system ImpA family N-terminal domain-containing protein [Atlantibacter hermannii]